MNPVEIPQCKAIGIKKNAKKFDLRRVLFCLLILDLFFMMLLADRLNVCSCVNECVCVLENRKINE